MCEKKAKPGEGVSLAAKEKRKRMVWKVDLGMGFLAIH